MLSLFLGRPRTRQRHLDALDGLRGLAVLVVIGSHLSNVGMLPRPGLSGTGKSGVYLFFVLSAYLLTRILLQRPLPHYGSQSWLVFDGARASARGVWEAPGRVVAVEP